MWTPEKVQEFAAKIAFKPMMTKPELQALHTILHTDEQLIYLLEGSLQKIHGRELTGQGMAILTNKRVIFFRKSFIGTITKEEANLNQISSTSFRKGVMSASVMVYVANNLSQIDSPSKSLAQEFQLKLQQAISAPQQVAQISPTVAEDNLTKLDKLFTLKEKGAITEGEYQEAKRKLLQQ